MVKIAIAGGSGQVAGEVIEALLATGKHSITILSRNQSSKRSALPEVQFRAVNYGDQRELVEALQGTHTLLSFIQLLSDTENKSQKNLIDAAITAGVKRFAPSEYGNAGTINMPWTSGKQSIREYLRELNKSEKVLEYTLFQPGLFMDYLAFPHRTSKYLDPLQTVFDYENCRALVVDGHEDAIMTLTTIGDTAAVVARAVELEDEWPEIGGIRGNRMTFSEIIEVGEKIRGRPFDIEKVKQEDLEGGALKASWGIEKRHHAVKDDSSSTLGQIVTIGILLSSVKGAWDVSDEFNQLLPDFRFKRLEHLVSEVWKVEQ